MSMKRAVEILKKHWGHDDFRKAQRVVVELALDDNDVLAVLPTGAGKSAAFQVPAMMRDGVAIVVSPLIALMKDQVDDCTRRGIPATYINSHVDDDERDTRLNDCVAGAYKLLYVAPERLNSKAFMETIARANVSYIVVDEAHCVSQFGHDFRPDYMRLGRIVTALTQDDGSRPPILAFTATATDKVTRDIVKSLGMVETHAQVIGDPLRSNLTYEVVMTGDSTTRSFRTVEGLLRGMDVRNGRHILYTNTRLMAERLVETADRVHRPGVATFYHAGLNREERTATQDAFKNGDNAIVCATTAFGMGVDVPNIRTVVNFGIPSSLEAYVQQCGRAGRDGKPSRSIVLVDDYSVGFQWRCVEDVNPPWEVYGLVWEYLHENLQPEGVLRRTIRQIVADIRKKREVQDAQVGVVLAALHSNALIDKKPTDAGTPVTIDVEKFNRALAQARGPEYVMAAWRSLNDRYVRPEVASSVVGQRQVTVYVNKRDIMSDAGIKSDTTVMKALDVLRGRGIEYIGSTYTGNQIRIRQWRASLDDVLPREAIEAKRALDTLRLRAMLTFVRLHEPVARMAYLRDYFLKPDAVEASLDNE